MKIPFTHYIRFWFKITILSIGTGFLIAYISFNFLAFIIGAFSLSAIFLFIAPIILLLFLIYSQIIVTKSFCGRERGKFEYSYVEHKFKNDTKLIVRRILSKHKYYGTFNEKLSHIINNQNTFSKELAEYNIDLNELQFFYLLFKAKTAIEEKDYKIAINILEKAKLLKNDDIISCYWLGRTFEYMDEKESAVFQYDNASEIAKDISLDIYKFFNIEKERVEHKGCKSEPKVLGLRYVSY